MLVDAQPRDIGWALILVLSLICTCAFVNRSILALLTEPIRANLNVGDVQMSLVIGVAFSVVCGLLNILAGYLVDRLGRRGRQGSHG
jgi:MFS family permease